MENKDPRMESIDFVYKKVLSLLSLSEIDGDSNLIEAGLSSIMMMQIASQLRKYGLKIQFAKLIEQPTLNDWNEIIQKADIRKVKKKEKIVSKCKNTEFDLTDVQYAYFIGRDDGQPLGGIGCHAYLEIDGEDVDAIKLNDAWHKIQNYHPMLRAKFLPTGKQIIMPQPYSKEIEILDFRNLSSEERERQLLDLRNNLSHRKLKIELGQVAGITLAYIKENMTRIFLDIDLLVADVLSLSIIMRDLADAYLGKEFTRNEDYTFQDYIIDRPLDESEIEKDRIFWENKMAKLSSKTPNIPLVKKPELIKELRFNRRRKVLSKEVWDKVKLTASKYQFTPSMFLLSCYGLVIERWCNQESFLINIPLFNRSDENENIQDMVADFTNLLLFDFTRKPQESFLSTMERVKTTFLENVAHSSYSGVSVQRNLFKTMGGAGFVAPIVFACNIDAPLETEVSRKVFGEISYMVSQTPQVWLDFQTYIKDGELILCWDAVEELYPKHLLDDMFEAFVGLIYQLAESKDWDIQVDLLPHQQVLQREAELAAILPLKYPDKLLITDFLECVKNRADDCALIEGMTGREISYGQLYDKAMQIANLLVCNGVQKGDYVAITLPRGVQQIYVIFGILFTGAVYVPVGTNQPKERRAKIYAQIGIKYVVTSKEVAQTDVLDEEGVMCLAIEDSAPENVLETPILVSPKDSAYVIMTSGSTGVPKGVEIAHESAVNTIDDINNRYHIASKDIEIMIAAIDFDLSVYDIFGILGKGGTLIILDDENYKDPDIWLKLMAEYPISVWNSTPMPFDMLVTMAENKHKILDLRVVMLSGDWIAQSLTTRFYNISKDAVVVAMGGATEASIWSNYINVPHKIPKHWRAIPYGKALDNQVYRVVDDLGRICPNYVQGELWIGGVGVAKGYRGDETLTKEKYITDKVKWYRTGDLGRTWQDGTIEFLGRKDHQVKIKGYRIELGEVEKALEKNKDIVEGAVCTIEGGTEGKQLAAYIILKNNITRSVEEIKAAMQDILPAYMIPEVYYFGNKLPLLANGKRNKDEICRVLSEQNSLEEFVAPEEGLEVEIARIWGNVLKTQCISRFDNFFRLGGDSLKAVDIVNQIEEILDVPMTIPVTILFKAATIEAFATEVRKMIDDMEVDVI